MSVEMNNSIQTAEISAVVQELNKACTVISDSDRQKEAARLRALSAAKDLVVKLQTPAETIFQLTFSVRTNLPLPSDGYLHSCYN